MFDTLPPDKKLTVVSRRTAPIHWALLGAILLLALAMRLWGIDREGFANEYYSGAVRSMLQNPRLFFFVSFDPGGFVSVDKPPLGLWIQTLFAFVLGFSGFAVILPQALAGTASAGAMFLLLRRDFGPWAGLIAALVLALTPINNAADRNNTMDAQLMLTLLLAAACLLRAARSGRLRWLLLSALLVGIGFNIKMLAAYLVVPAFLIVYFAGSNLSFLRRAAYLLSACFVMLVVSFAWPLTVDLTPTEWRPYVGSSQENSALELIFGHNGVSRILPAIRGRPLRQQPDGNQPSMLPQDRQQPIQPQNNPPAGNLQDGPNLQNPGGKPVCVPVAPNLQGLEPIPPITTNDRPPLSCPEGYRLVEKPSMPDPGMQAANPADPMQNPSPDGGQPGGNQSEAGDPGLLRLFNRQLAGQASWMFAFIFVGLLAILFHGKIQFPLIPEHRQIALWAVWVLAQVPVYSFGGIFHRYYLELLSPGIAALAGAGLVVMWDQFRAGGWRRLFLPAAFAASAALQIVLLGIHFPDWAFWLGIPLAGLTVLAVGVLAACALLPAGALSRITLTAAAAAGFAAQLITPAVWSSFPVLGAGNAHLPYTDPDLLVKRPEPATEVTPLMQYLLREYGGEKYLVTGPNAFTTAPYIILTGLPVMTVGGFSGGDPILTIDELAAKIASGEVRFFLLTQSPSGSSEWMSWVGGHCSLVPEQSYGARPVQPQAVPGQNGQGTRLFDCLGAQ